jgi:APA family basic amino acid/polyamine antiporter
MTPAADTAGRWFGAGGERFVSAAISISTFGFLNLAVLAPTRVYYAIAADGAFPAALAKLHPKYGTPGAAIILQSAWAIALALTGEYGDLLDTVVFADWIFFGLTVGGLFILRRKLKTGVAFRVTDIASVFFIAMAIVTVCSSILDAPLRSGVGALLLLAGIPAYYGFKSMRGRS